MHPPPFTHTHRHTDTDTDTHTREARPYMEAGDMDDAKVLLLVLVRPVLFTLDAAVLHKLGEHHNDCGALLPHKAPKVAHCLGQRPLGADVLKL